MLLGRLRESIYDWFAAADAAEPADAIFVLAGRDCRKTDGLRLFEAGLAPRLLLSVDRFEIRHMRRFALCNALNLSARAASLQPSKRHFFIDIKASKAVADQIDIGWLGTWGEVSAFAKWLNDNKEIRTAIVISSGFHLRRLRWCCRKLVTSRVKLVFTSVREEDTYFRRYWLSRRKALRLVVGDALKIALYASACPLLVLWTRAKSYWTGCGRDRDLKRDYSGYFSEGRIS